MPTPIEIRTARENIARAAKALNQQIKFAEAQGVKVEVLHSYGTNGTEVSVEVSGE